jgi:hypothetical protein
VYGNLKKKEVQIHVSCNVARDTSSYPSTFNLFIRIECFSKTVGVGVVDGAVRVACGTRGRWLLLPPNFVFLPSPPERADDVGWCPPRGTSMLSEGAPEFTSSGVYPFVFALAVPIKNRASRA